MTKRVVIGEIFVAKRHCLNALTNQYDNLMLNEVRTPQIMKALRKSVHTIARSIAPSNSDPASDEMLPTSKELQVCGLQRVRIQTNLMCTVSASGALFDSG
jgi:hypothetical protein